MHQAAGKDRTSHRRTLCFRIDSSRVRKDNALTIECNEKGGYTSNVVILEKLCVVLLHLLVSKTLWGLLIITSSENEERSLGSSNALSSAIAILAG